MVAKNKNNKEKKEVLNPDKNENNEEKIKAHAGKKESWNELFGIKIENLSYIKGNNLEKSVKINSNNYNSEIGKINEGENYIKNENHKYTLYIPEDAINKKTKYK